MNNLHLSLALASLLAAGSVANAGIKVHTIGDSTMATYDESATVTRGWGMYLQQFLSGVTVNNRGKGGASSKSFYQEAAYWTSVKSQMSEGDYVLIQFAHNDEKNSGMDGNEVIDYYKSIGDATSAAATDYRGTTPTGTYKDYLRKYVEETRAAGCTPVLVGPVCRKYFTGSTIRRNGRHDLGDSFSVLTETGILTSQKVDASDHSMDYAYQMKLVAEEMDVTFLDLTTATKELYESYGDSKCNTLLFDGDGSTHFNTTGATLVARLAAQLMKEAGILADNVVLTSDVSVSPAVAELGEAYRGQSLVKEFSLSGFSLSPATGSVEISATSGLLLSTDKSTWTSSLSLDYSDATLISSFFAKCDLVNDGQVSEIISISCAGKTIEIPVTATAISLVGGQQVKAYWRLESSADCELTGPAGVVDENFSSMYIQKYSAPNSATVWPSETGYTAERKMQRTLLVGDTWPSGEVDEVSTRYVEFGITPSAGMVLKINNISMFLCGAGGNGMMCHVNYSAEKDFANQHCIFAPTSMTSNTVYAVESTPDISLSEGDTLRVRVYPWYNTSATGKTICISDVTISGVAMSADEAQADAIAPVRCESDVNNVVYYDLAGRQIAAPAHGLCIRRCGSSTSRILVP